MRRTGPIRTADDVQAYVKSKTLAERAAWDFIAREGGGLELSVVNPVACSARSWGRLFDLDPLVQRLMDGAVPGCPRLYFGVVDVRDVADLHIRAMTHPAAKGERFLAVAGDFMSIVEIAKVLKARMGASAKRVPTRQLPDWLVRLAALRDPTIKADPARTRQEEERHERKGQATAGLGAALERGVHRGHRRKFGAPWASEGQPEKSRARASSPKKNPHPSQER
jgi:nucleoside-diphosphate-sugar epimerase